MSKSKNKMLGMTTKLPYFYFQQLRVNQCFASDIGCFLNYESATKLYILILKEKVADRYNIVILNKTFISDGKRTGQK